ncbi:MAG: hypothetical protein JWR88_189 [Pseudonocardia sp.]|nr:hypothetical protein [Pseudonocardia sp.]
MLSSLVVTGVIWGVVLLVAAVALQGANVIKSGLASWQAIVLFGGTVMMAVAVRFGVTRLTRSLLAGRLAQLVPLAVLIWVAIVPLVREITVDEAAPAVAAAAGVSAAPAPAPTELGRAIFEPLDHSVSGSAVLLDLGGGVQAVRFENFTVQPGPDYLVYVVNGRDARRPDGGTELGRLKGTRGSQNYEVPAQAVGSGPVTVLIWCRAFAVPIANATVIG